MKKMLCVLPVLFLAVSCMHFKLHMPSPPPLGGSKAVLIGPFERRSLSFDPFVAQNLRDSLGYDLFRLGFRPRVLAPEDMEGPGMKSSMKLLSREAVRDLCAKHGASILIQGAVSEREIGLFTDTDTSTLVVFQINGKDGEKIGEAYASTSDTLSDVSVLKSIVQRFAERLNGELNGAP